jgi:hypothetical protein
VISTYSRQQAIEDGVLIDIGPIVSKLLDVVVKPGGIAMAIGLYAFAIEGKDDEVAKYESVKFVIQQSLSYLRWQFWSGTDEKMEFCTVTVDANRDQKMWVCLNGEGVTLGAPEDW